VTLPPLRALNPEPAAMADDTRSVPSSGHPLWK